MGRVYDGLEGLTGPGGGEGGGWENLRRGG